MQDEARRIDAAVLCERRDQRRGKTEYPIGCHREENQFNH